MTAPRLPELLACYATLAPTNLDALVQCYTPDAHFRDPFHDVQGQAAIRAIFAHMFAASEQPRFVITEQQLAGATAFVTWRFHFGLRGHDYCIEGATRFGFATDGRVCCHRDYWDAAEELFQKLPLVGPPIAWLRRRFRATGTY